MVWGRCRGECWVTCSGRALCVHACAVLRAPGGWHLGLAGAIGWAVFVCWCCPGRGRGKCSVVVRAWGFSVGLWQPLVLWLGWRDIGSMSCRAEGGPG